MSDNGHDEYDLECETLTTALRTVHEGVIMFFSNKFEECEEFIDNKMATDPKSAPTIQYGLALLKFTLAIFTNEKVSELVTLIDVLI